MTFNPSDNIQQVKRLSKEIENDHDIYDDYISSESAESEMSATKQEMLIKNRIFINEETNLYDIDSQLEG